MSKYEISMEVSGPLAMRARPDTGTTPTSYPVPTWSATKGMFEAIAFFNNGRAWINPIRVEICKPVCQQYDPGAMHFQRYKTNYGGPLRENHKASYQCSALVISNPCYRLYAQIEMVQGKTCDMEITLHMHCKLFLSDVCEKGSVTIHHI